MIACAFAIPGDIDLPTGGYSYDRRVLERLRDHGIEVRYVALRGSFPTPTKADLEATRITLSSLPAESVLLIDGLAFGALPGDLLRAVSHPIVALCHHPLAHEAGLSEGQQQHFRRSETAALAMARHVVVTSATTARTLIADFAVAAGNVTVAEPGTDRAPRAKGTRDPIQLLAVGSIVPRKGFDVLVDALSTVTEHDWRLSLAGADDRSPETTRNLHRQIVASGLAGRIQLIGAVSEAELARLYDRADIFLMPSLYEGYGMVLTEAMARGLPIVCTTGGAAAETVPDEAALKVPPGNASAFAVALRSLITDTGQRGRMSDAAWVAAHTLPTWDDTARIIAGVIRKVAA